MRIGGAAWLHYAGIMSIAPALLPPVSRINLHAQVYDALNLALLEGRLRPSQRLKIRDIAAAMEVSETPVREAVMQLVREHALVLQTARSLTVPRLSVPQYLELRRIRLELEGLAAAAAAPLIGQREIASLARLHAQLLKAEAAGQASDAVRLNWHFHSTLYRAASMPELFNVILGLWLRTGPRLTFQYPNAVPTYPGRHRHLDVLDALRAADGPATRAAIQADTLEGGARLLQLLRDLDAGRIDEASLAADPALADLLPTR